MTPHLDKHGMIVQVLKSRRLLSEHIETLENYLHFYPVPEPKHQAGRAILPVASTVVSVSLVGLSIRASGSSLPVALGTGAAAVGLSCLAGYQWRRTYTHWKYKQELTKLLDALDQYSSLLKKNLNYLTDLSMFQGTPSLRDQILGTACVDSVVGVIRLLHSFVTQLDELAPLTQILPTYQPFEDLGDFETESGLKNFKALYTVFLYIQSQFVLRVTLGLAEDQLKVGDVKEVTDALTKEVSREDIHIPKSKSNETSLRRPARDTWETLPGLRHLKLSVSNVETKLMVQLNQFQSLADQLSRVPDDGAEERIRSKLLELNQQLSIVESLFLSSACEFESVQLSLRKLLNIQTTPKKEALPIEPNPESLDAPPAKVVDQSTVCDIDDEFFLLDGQMPDQEDQKTPVDHVTNERVLKRSFKPVLKQLMKEIDPRNSEMIERERKFLQQQGVELPAEVVAVPKAPLCSRSSTEASDDEVDDNLVLRRKKKNPRPSKYDENRQFLEEKVQMGQFRLPVPPKLIPSTTEDVLE